MIEVHYFASIREALDTEKEEIELPKEVTTVSQLIEYLVSIHGRQWSKHLQDTKVLVAINQTMAKVSSDINSGDEVAFFPPVTGG